MAFSQVNFQPETAEQAHPFATGFAKSQDLYRNALANALGQIQLQYAPQMTQAELGYKQAQGPLAQAQTKQAQEEAARIAFLIKNPQYMQPEGYLYGSPAARSELGYGSGDNGGRGGIPNNGGGINPNIGGSPPGGNTQNVPVSNTPGPNVPGGGNGSKVTPGSLIDKLLHPLSFHQQEKASDLNQELVQKTSEQGEPDTQLGYTLSNMQALYPKLQWYETGKPFGYGPGLSDAAQRYDQAISNYNANLVKLWQSGRITENELNYFQTAGFSRALNPGAFDDAIKFTSAIQKRSIERPGFYAEAVAKGYKPNQYQPLWIKYINERPVTNGTELIPENLNTGDDYLTDEAVASLKTQKPFSPHLTPNKTQDQLQNQSQGQSQSQVQPYSPPQSNANQKSYKPGNNYTVLAPTGKKYVLKNIKDVQRLLKDYPDHVLTGTR